MTREYWFRQRLYGLGSGPPIHWKGWVLTIAWLAMVLLCALIVQSRPVVAAIALAAVTAVFIWQCWRRTEGGWRWRWGK